MKDVAIIIRDQFDTLDRRYYCYTCSVILLDVESCSSRKQIARLIRIIEMIDFVTEVLLLFYASSRIIVKQQYRW